MLILFKFFAIIFLILFLLAFVSRIALRRFFRRMQNQQDPRQQNKSNRREGDVYVTKNPQKDKIVDKDVGDYVDYEEVE